MSDERMRFTSAGNVGIGTNNPQNKLHVDAGATTAINTYPLKISGTTGFANLGNGTATFIGLSTEASSWTKCAIGHCRTNSNDRGSIVLCCNNVNDSTSVSMSDERMRITSDGNVGIGVTNPSYKMHLCNTAVVATGTTGTTSMPLRISAGAYSDTGNETATLIGLATQETAGTVWTKCAIGHCRTAQFDVGSIVFLCNNSATSTSVTMSDERMRITRAGNVGSGTNSHGKI
jgi:hypothetical protein